MRNVNEISFEEFTDIMDWLHTCANESPQNYIHVYLIYADIGNQV